MNKQLEHNLSTFRNGITKKIPRIEERLVVSLFTKVADSVYTWIDNHTATYEDDTYNLRDSIGVGVYKKGILVKWVQMPEKKATQPRNFAYKDSPYYTKINGRELLMSALSKNLYAGMSDYELIVYCTAPYGLLVEMGDGKRGTGWWSELFIPYVIERFNYEFEILRKKW